MSAYPDRIPGHYEEPFWDYIEDGELRLQHCTECGHWRFPPGAVCPECLSMDAEWEAVSGNGEVYSFVVFQQQYFEAYEPPYNVAVVELEEGPFFVGNVVDTEDLEIGMPVSLTFEQVSDEIVLPRFTERD